MIDYGIPDLSDFSATNVEDHARLAAVIAKAVAAFEPRLREVRVAAGGYDETARSLTLEISGTLVVDAWREPVSFPTILGIRNGETKVLGEGG